MLTRRTCVARISGVAASLAVPQMGFARDPLDTEYLMDRLRKSVLVLSNSPEGAVLQNSQIAVIKEICMLLIETGTTKIAQPVTPLDRACNHWLKSMQSWI
jgi:hypothetical protein